MGECERVTGALEHIGDRVRHLVYLDALVPGDGDRPGATCRGRVPAPARSRSAEPSERPAWRAGDRYSRPANGPVRAAAWLFV